MSDPRPRCRCCHNCIEFCSYANGAGYCFIEEEKLLDEWMEMNKKVLNGEEIPFGGFSRRVPNTIHRPDWQVCHRWEWNKRDME